MTSESYKRTEQPAFIRRQLEFTANIRHPDNPAPQDIADDRMSVYRELFYNNVEDFIASSYPVIREITSDDNWHDMIRDYYSVHKSKTPLFPTMPQEFLAYLQHERNNENDPPFLAELAHYEWVELALITTDEEIDLSQVDANAELLDGIPVLSPLVLPLCYQYPVHRIGPDYLPESPESPATYLAVYRDRQDDVGFLEINPVTYRLMQLLMENQSQSGRQLLERVANELPDLDSEAVIQGGQQALEQLKQKGIVLGTLIDN